MPPRVLSLPLLIAIFVAACSGSASPGTGAVVTFDVLGEEYRILVTDEAEIEIARRLLAGEPAPDIPNGVIVYGNDGGVNTGWSWHIDPATFEFADMTTEVCDALPSDVEDRIITGTRFCPWAARVVAVEE